MKYLIITRAISGIINIKFLNLAFQFLQLKIKQKNHLKFNEVILASINTKR